MRVAFVIADVGKRAPAGKAKRVWLTASVIQDAGRRGPVRRRTATRPRTDLGGRLCAAICGTKSTTPREHQRPRGVALVETTTGWDITRARRGLHGAEAILKLRAIASDNDFDHYADSLVAPTWARKSSAQTR